MSEGYVMAGQRSEPERLQLQARLWEPAGRTVLKRAGDGRGLRALDVGCGALGWLRILSEWVGSEGEVVGSDIDDTFLRAAGDLLQAEGLANVTLANDDLFDSRLEPESFDLVHARFQLAPLGRMDEQIAAYRRLVKHGGWIVLEEPDNSSWHYNPPAQAAERLIALIEQTFATAGGDMNAGRALPALLHRLGLEPSIDAHVLALPPGHPYQRLPLQFATSLQQRLLALVSGQELAALRAEAERELADPHRWGTTFVLIQAPAKIPQEA